MSQHVELDISNNTIIIPSSTNSNSTLNSSLLKETKRNLPTKHRRGKLFNITTRWGKLEISIDNIFSFLIMILTLISILSLAIACFYSAILVAFRGKDVYTHFTNSNVELNNISNQMKLMFEYEGTNYKFVEKLNNSLLNLVNSISDLGLDIERINQLGVFKSDSIIDNPHQYVYLLSSSIDYQVKEYMEFYTENGYSNVFTYSNVINLINETRIFYDKVLTLGDQYIQTKDDYIDGISIVGLVLTLILLLFMIPISFSITFKTLMNNEKLLEKLKRVDAKRVKETILDSYLGEQFKEFCKQERQLRYFLFLEKSIEFTQYCDNIYNLDHNSELSIEDQDDISKIENEIDKFQSKKCEIIFEIKTEFLNLKGEHFLGEKQIGGGKKLIQRVKQEFKSNPMNLPDDLLDEIESNISIHLFTTFKSFQKTMLNKKRNYTSQSMNNLHKY